MTESDTRFFAALVWSVLAGWGASHIAYAAGVTHGDWASFIGIVVGVVLMIAGQETTQ